jgi:HlyD family secretion protein
MKFKTYGALLGLGVAIIGGVAAYIIFQPDETVGLLEASGQVRGTEITVSSKVPGKLESLTVKEGQSVQTGELLGRISG